jgi:hypothetical protein
MSGLLTTDIATLTANDALLLAQHNRPRTPGLEVWDGKGEAHEVAGLNFSLIEVMPKYGVRISGYLLQCEGEYVASRGWLRKGFAWTSIYETKREALAVAAKLAAALA